MGASPTLGTICLMRSRLERFQLGLISRTRWVRVPPPLPIASQRNTQGVITIRAFSDKGSTPVLHSGSGGSIPPRSTNKG